MDAIRNIINPGKNKDDEIMYGTGHKATVSHIERAPQRTTAPPSRPAETGQHYGTDGQIGSTTGPQPSDMANKADRRVEPAHETRQQAGPESGNRLTGQGNSIASRPAAQRMLPDDDASTASIKSGIAGRPPRSTLTGSPAIGSNLIADTNQPSTSVGHEAKGAERAFPLSGGTTKEPTSTADASQNPHATRDNTAGVPPKAGLLGFLHRHEHGGHGHRYEGDPCKPGTDKQNEAQFAPGPHATDTANRLDPQLSSTGTDKATEATGAPESGQQSKHHYGRDAALAGAGAAAAGGAYKAGQQDPSTTTGPASKTIGPHESNLANVADPRVQPDPAKMKGEYVGSESMPGSGPSGIRTQEQEQGGQHYGRDAALAGTGAAAVGGTYEAGHQDPSTTTGPASKTIGPHSSNIANVVDPRVQPDPAKMKGEYAGGPKGPQAYTGKEGAAATASGETYRAGDPDPSMTTGPASKTHGPHTSNLANVMDPRVLPDPQKMKGKNAGANDENPYSRTPIDSRVDYDNAAAQQIQPGESHHGRDVGVAGGAIGGAAAAHELSKHDSEKGEKERLREKDKLEKKMAKDERHHEKELEKAHKHDAKKAQNHATKEEKKEEKHHEQEEEKKHGRRKSHGILGFFKRDKSEEEPRQEEYDHKERERAAAGTAGVAGVAAGASMAHQEHEQYEGRNRLHKDPPAGYASQEPEPSTSTGTEQHAGQTTGSSQAVTGTGVGSGTPATAAGTSGHEATAQKGIVKEPYTGLPMNVGKYGTTGAGGVDAGPFPGAERTEDVRAFGVEPPEPQVEESREDKYVKEPYTGLPMNVGRYGTTGAGGVDAGPFPGAERTEDIRGLGVEPPASQVEESREDKFVKEPNTGLPMNVGKYDTTDSGGVDAGPVPGAEKTENVEGQGPDHPSSATGQSSTFSKPESTESGATEDSAYRRMPGAYENQY